MRPLKLNDILDILKKLDSDLDLSDDEDSYINIAVAGSNEEKAKESDADSDKSDDETAANTLHHPRRLLESDVQITTRQKVINVKKNVDASKNNIPVRAVVLKERTLRLLPQGNAQNYKLKKNQRNQ